jgi:hypothetical protein
MSDNNSKIRPRAGASPAFGGINRRSLLRSAFLGGVTIAVPREAYSASPQHGASVMEMGPSDTEVPQTPLLEKLELASVV